MAPVLAKILGVLFGIVALSGLMNVVVFSLATFGPSSSPIAAKDRAMSVGYLVFCGCALLP
jgi:hypothetical protein